MLGALLAALQVIHPLDVLDATIREDENEDIHWASDTNRFEDWLLNSDAPDDDLEVYY